MLNTSVFLSCIVLQLFLFTVKKGKQLMLNIQLILECQIGIHNLHRQNDRNYWFFFPQLHRSPAYLVHGEEGEAADVGRVVRGHPAQANLHHDSINEEI